MLSEANEEMIFTEEDQMKYDRETRYHICGEGFSPEKKNMEHLEERRHFRGKHWETLNYETRGATSFLSLICGGISF